MPADPDTAYTGDADRLRALMTTAEWDRMRTVSRG